MASKSSKSSSKSKSSSRSTKKKTGKVQVDEFSSLAIEQQTAAFLAAGGKIKQIPVGVSGQVSTSGPRHITLGRRHSN